MLRFIALSLAMHGLLIGAWYDQETGPEEISGGRTLALALLPNAAKETDNRIKAQADHNTQNTARAALQPTPLSHRRTRAQEKQQTLPVAANHQQSVPARADHIAAAASVTSGDTLATATRGLASPAYEATTPAADDMLARHSVQTAVSIALKENFRYPRIARRNGWEGTVILAIRVLPDGQLTDILVSSSSGHPVLDRAAIKILQTASVPQAKQWLNDQAVDLVVPVEYRLLEG